MSTSRGYQRQIRTPDELGSVISELRSHRRKTQFEVASALAIDRSQLAHLEGGRSGRYLAHLLNILDHLGAELQIHWPSDPANQGVSSSQIDPSFALTSSVPVDSLTSVSKGTRMQSARSRGPWPDSLGPVSSVGSVTKVAPGAPSNPAVGPEALSPDDVNEVSDVNGPVGPNALSDFDVDVDVDVEAPGETGTEATIEGTAIPTADLSAESTAEATTEANTGVEESTSAQLTKIANLAMNVMAASQQLSGQPRSSR